MKKKITILMLKVVLRWFTVHVASNMLIDAKYGEGFTEAIKLAHRNIHQGKAVTFSKQFEGLDKTCPELLEVTLFANRKKIKVEYV